MGFIRGGLLVIVSVLLFLVFLIANSLLTATLTLDYENVKPELVNIAQDLIEQQAGQQVDEALSEYQDEFEEYCQSNEEFVFNEAGYDFVLSCDNLVNASLDNFVEKSVGSVVEKMYYKEYDCEFWDCLKQGDPLFLVSEKAHVYWKTKFLQSLLVIGVLLVLVFFLVSKKANTLILAGSLLIGSSIPFLGLQKLSEFLMTKDILDFLGIIFSKANIVFWISFIVGFVLLAAGIGLRIFGISLNISEKLSQKKQENSQDKKEKPSGKKSEKPKQVSIEKVEKQGIEKKKFFDSLKKKLGR